MSGPEDLVASALSAPAAVRDWPLERWSRLFQQARAAGLFGRIASPSSGCSWPDAVGGHVESAQRVYRAQQEEIRRETGFIRRALADLGAPVVLLKGAAYVMAGLPAAEGRLFSDIDILVPKAALAQAESMLTLAGWMTTHHSAYDQRYYREWMHELPPMQHVHRQTTIDVHHTILPETARLHPDPRKLFEAAVPLAGAPGFHVLGPADMLLHSMTHLFMNDDMSHALRDLSDLDRLLRHFGSNDNFWLQLPPRAAELDLRRPLFYGLRYTAQILGTPVPPHVEAATADWGPPPGLSAVMDAIWRRALRSPHPSAALPLTGAALFALYLRGHWLRMPPVLLARHLTIKALRRPEPSPPSEPPPR